MKKYCHRHRLPYQGLCPQCQVEAEETIKAFRELYGDPIPTICPDCHADLVEAFGSREQCALVCLEHGQVWEDKTGMVRCVNTSTSSRA